MRDRMLLGRRHLRKRAPVAFDRHEHRVVAEAVLSGRNRGDDPFDGSPHRDLASVGPAGEGHGREPRVAQRRVDAFELTEQLGHIVGVGRVGSGVARRVHAGRACERVDLEPGVVGDREHVHGRRAARRP